MLVKNTYLETRPLCEATISILTLCVRLIHNAGGTDLICGVL